MPPLSSSFNGFSRAGLRFLRDLAKNNDRAWFAQRKAIYETELLEPMRAYVADATKALGKAKISLGGDPKRTPFRIYRDTRFSIDKSPYKTNAGVYLTRDGTRESPGGLYLHVEPKACFVAAGFYRIDKPLLQRWREAMAGEPKRFAAMLRALERNGLAVDESRDELKRMPRGFEAQSASPIATYFRYGSFMVSDMLTDAEVADPGLIERVVAFAKKSKPLLEYGWALFE